MGGNLKSIKKIQNKFNVDNWILNEIPLCMCILPCGESQLINVAAIKNYGEVACLTALVINKARWQS